MSTTDDLVCDSACASFGAVLEPFYPCFGSVMIGCSSRVEWYGRCANGSKCVSITIDDFPRESSTVADVQRLLCTLEGYCAHVTFFVVLERLKRLSFEEAHEIIRSVRSKGHELGVHFEGSAGCLRSDKRLLCATVELMRFVESSVCEEDDFRFCVVRPAGGWANRSVVDAWKDGLELTTVLGTAYPFDDVRCLRLVRSAHGEASCAFNMSRGGNRTVVLHDSDRLERTVDRLLHLASARTIRSLTLSRLLGIERVSFKVPNTVKMKRRVSESRLHN